MTKQQHLYLKLIEECSEVQHRAAKLMQYGPNERQATSLFETAKDAPSGDSNLERLIEEVLDLQSVINLLGIRYPNEKEILQKKAKILKYRAYSESLGEVT